MIDGQVYLAFSLDDFYKQSNSNVTKVAILIFHSCELELCEIGEMLEWVYTILLLSYVFAIGSMYSL